MKNTAPTKNKKLYYRRANFGKLALKSTLQKMLETSLDATKDVGSRTFAGGHGAEIRCSNFKLGDNGLYMQVTTYTPGQATSTIVSAVNVKQSDVDEESAPNGKDFVDGEGFVFVKGDDVILCMSIAREPLIEKYFRALLESQKFVAEASNLELEVVANINSINMIQKEGVKEFSLGCSLYDASVQRLHNKSKLISGILGKVVDQFEAVFSTDASLKDIDDKENLDIKLSVSFDGRSAMSKDNKKIQGFGDIGKARLLESAISLVNEPNGPEFTITTGLGNTITPDAIRVSGSKKIETLGKSLMRNDAWRQLHLYYTELKAAGILEQ